MNPQLIDFPKIGSRDIGYVSIAEKLPFDIKRVYWTYYTPEDVARGGHAHYELEQILIAVSGTITVHTQTVTGEDNRFILTNPNQGLYIPKMCWRNLKYSHNAVQICLASQEYTEKDYIRNYETFKGLIK